MPALRDILKALPEHAQLKDGAMTWTPENLADALEEDDLKREYGWDDLGLCPIDKDGFLGNPQFRLVEPVAIFIERDEPDAGQPRDWYDVLRLGEHALCADGAVVDRDGAVRLTADERDEQGIRNAIDLARERDCTPDAGPK